MKFTLYILLFVNTFAEFAFAGEFITTEPNNNSYQYVSSYNIEIEAPAEKVWKHLENLKSWMYEFEMSHHSGSPGEVGEVLRLYPNQNFLIQITGKVKGEALIISNLPTTFSGEYSTGIGVINLGRAGTNTIVNFIMSRRYTSQGEGCLLYTSDAADE